MRQLRGRVPLRGRGFAPRLVPVAGVATLLGLLLAWQVGSAAGLIPALFLPAPSGVVRALVQLTRSGALWEQVAPSLERLAGGWALGTVAGIIVGLAAGVSSWVRSPALAVVSALFPIPKIALVPLFIIWFGIGEGSKIATIALGVFFPTIISTMGGVDAVPKNLIRMGQAFELGSWAILRKIVLPGALPAILSGCRITASLAIILLVAAEMIGAEHGIGVFVLSAGNLYDTDNLLAGLVILSLIGLVIAFILTRLERHLLRWR